MDREINYLVLRYLENYLDPEEYEKLKEKCLPKLSLPRIYNWTGNQRALSFEQLRFDRSHFNSNYLIDLFATLVHNSKTPILAKENIGFAQDTQNESPLAIKPKDPPLALKKRAFCVVNKNKGFHPKRLQNMSVGEAMLRKFSRMKTVYGHANLGEQPMSISCVEFDLTNKYIITGADDRLIKVWLLSNGSLQGVLHGHTDVIMDLHISFCNRYIISAGKEGIIHIWDLKNMKHLHSCEEHKGAVNNIKAVQTKLAYSEVQLLYSASDDGLINVYNLDKIGYKGLHQDDPENTVKTRRAKPREKKSPVFLFSLNSIEFTGLKKNKKINSIDISNKRGLILAGCYGGDLLIWRTDNYRREKVVKEAYELVSKIKAHGQTLHMISISPDENYFMTGSVDGTANIWKPPETATEIIELIGELENGRKEGANKKEHPFKKNLVKALDANADMSISQ